MQFRSQVLNEFRSYDLPIIELNRNNKKEAVLSLPLDSYQKWKQPLTEGYWKAAKFLRQESFFSTNDLPYRTQLVPLATVMAFLGDRWLEPKIYDKIARWFWCGILGELYGGAVETRIALDIQELIDWIEGGKEEPSSVRDANFQPTRLSTLRSRNSAAYKGINVLVQREGAQDFFWKVAIRDLDETDWEERKLDIHHIFPKSWCDKNGISASRVQENKSQGKEEEEERSRRRSASGKYHGRVTLSRQEENKFCD